MTNTSKTIVFFGNERLVSGLIKTEVPILRGLIRDGYDVTAVISHHSDGQSRNNRVLEVAEVAREHDIPVFLPNDPTEIIDTLKQTHAVAGILVAYGRIIAQNIIDIFPMGIINIHPSLLPKYRGPTPIESAIVHGDIETGISIMQLSAEMDRGPVYIQKKVSLSGTETKFEVYDRIAQESSSLLLESLPSILDGTLQPQPQDDNAASYSKLLSKSDGYLDVSTHSAIECDRIVRAHLGFPKTKMTLLGHDVIITKAHVVSKASSKMDVACMVGFLAIDELIGPSGRTMNAQSFLNGYAAG